MNAIKHRSMGLFGSLLLVAAAALTGCATTGAATATLGNAARPLDAAVTTPTGYVVCSGASASRFPEREAAGRVCRPSPSLVNAIY